MIEKLIWQHHLIIDKNGEEENSVLIEILAKGPEVFLKLIITVLYHILNILRMSVNRMSMNSQFRTVNEGVKSKTFEPS